MFEITDRESILKKEEDKSDGSSGFFSMGKKGMSVDNLFTMISFFATAVLFLVIIVFWNEASALDQLWKDNPTTEQIKDDTQSFVNLMDFMMVMAYIGLHLGIIVLGWLLRTHPVLLVVGFLLTALLAVVAAPLSNAWNDFSGEPKLDTASNDLVVTDFIMDNLPKFEVVWAVITGIVMFGLAQGRGSGGRSASKGGFR